MCIRDSDITGMSFMFGISDEEWENLESDHPTRHIRALSVVVEVSAVKMCIRDRDTSYV